MKQFLLRLRVSLTLGICILFLGFSNYSWAKETGLLGLWHFNEGKGEIAKDSSGAGNDGKIYGAKWVKTNQGYALSFDGDGDYVDLGNAGNLTSEYGSISFWFKANNPNNKETFLMFGKNPYTDYFRIWKGASDEKPGCYRNELVVYLKKDSQFKLLKMSSILINDINWHNVVLTQDGADLKIYIDGVYDSRAGGGFRGPQSAWTDFINSTHNAIGGDAQKQLGYFDGLIDEVAIFDIALSADEVKNHYRAGRP